MAGMEVVVVGVAENGDIDLADFAAKAEARATGWRRR
jgi:glycine cleavage system protein P-like pyridoxal-binding family